MNITINKNRHFFNIFILYLLVFTSIFSSVKGNVLPLDHAMLLQEWGYPSDTVQQIIAATKSESYAIRFLALELLIQRIGDEAIPTLKDALDDPRMEVRWRVAHLLGTLGDKSGLERMRQDLKEFAPNNGAPVPPDPNIVDANEEKEREGKRNLRLYYALSAARILAELEDRRGYDLAARMALHGDWEIQRIKAAHVLVEIARADTNILSAEGKEPASILCAMADSEKSQAVFRTLTSSVQRLGNHISIRVLERALNSPHHSEKMRKLIKLRLDKVKARIKGSSENKPKD